MSKAALLVIDVQRAFFDGTAIPPVHDGEQILARISEVVQRIRAAGLPIVYVQHAGGSGHPLEREGEGWQIHPDIQPRDGDTVVAKTTPDGFHKTSLQADLDALCAENLIVVGNQTEFCVDTTCRRAFSLGYKVTLLTDAHSTWDSEHLKAHQIIDHHNYVLGRQFVSVDEAGNIDLAQFS